MRPTYAEIDLGAIRHNVRAFAELIAPSQVCAVVKADAYGHGDAPVAAVAIEAGAVRLAVALVEEGVRLREAGIEVPILVMSAADPTSVDDMVKWDLTPTVYSVDAIEGLGSVGVPLSAHVKIDTGMHRIGAEPRLARELMAAADSNNIIIEGAWTHFAVAEDDSDFTSRQIELFDSAIDGMDIPMIHMANTAGATLFPTARRDFCRIGLGLYGLHPSALTREVVDLRPAMRIISAVSHVQRLTVGTRPSYGRIRPLRQDSTVVTVPIGYHDGFPRGLTEYGCALIGGHRYPLAGRVTMDQIVVDVGDSEFGVGEEVVLMGTQGSQEVSADEWAEALGTITNEVVCRVGPRVPRKYLG